MNLVKFNDIELEVLEYERTWALSDRQVALGFGVDKETIRKQRTQGATEYLEGVHYFYKDMYNDGKGGLTDTPDKSGGVYQTPQKMVFWTKKGVITLGFKLRETPATIAFRDWASDYIIKSDEIVSQNTLKFKFNQVLQELGEKSSEADMYKQKYYESLESEVRLLRNALSNARAKEPNKQKIVGVGHKFSQDELARAKKLYDSGLSFADIGKELNRHPTTVSANLKKARYLRQDSLF